MQRIVAALLLLCSLTGRPAAAAGPERTWVLTVIDAPEALARAALIADGQALRPVTVAVLDTGVNAALPELASRLWPGLNAISGPPAAYSPDPGEHGTEVAAVLASATAGFPVRILPVTVLGADGSGDPGDLARAIRLAVDWRGPGGERAMVINLSLGERMRTAPPDLAGAIGYAMRQDVIVVAAAGNEGRSLAGYYPAALPGVLSVGALRPDLTAEPLSNTGALLLAPAAGGHTGTSFAAPLVSAGAAVLYSVLPELSWAEVMQALLDGHRAHPCPEGRCPVFSINRALANLGPRRFLPYSDCPKKGGIAGGCRSLVGRF